MCRNMVPAGHRIQILDSRPSLLTHENMPGDVLGDWLFDRESSQLTGRTIKAPLEKIRPLSELYLGSR